MRVDSPAPERAPPPLALDTADLKAAWQSMTGSLEGLLATQAADVHDVRLASDGSVVVSFAASDQFSKDMCDNPSNRAVLEQSLTAEVGTPVSLRFEIDKSATGTATTLPAKPRGMSRRRVQAEVAERPFVARAMELFSADASKLRVTPPRDKNAR